MKVRCGHCWGYHESVAQVRNCSGQMKGGTLPPPWLTRKAKTQEIAKRVVSEYEPTAVVVAKDGTVSWTNPKRNPWKELHHQAERDYTDGEYTPRMGRAAVEREFEGTSSYGYLCPNAKCERGYCHYRATVNSSICENCRTAMHSGSHEVYSKGTDFEPTQWYLIRLARWLLAEAGKVERYNSGWDIIAEAYTEAEMVDLLREQDLLKFDKAVKYLQELVDLKSEQRRAVQNTAF
jgi:hypothetical protein